MVWGIYLKFTRENCGVGGSWVKVRSENMLESGKNAKMGK
jgi:hypothetical protein